MIRACLALAGSLILATAAWADDHPGQGKGKGQGQGQGQSQSQGRDQGRDGGRGSGGVSLSIEIHDTNRTLIRDYYGAEFARGACPPGLAKKNNGCMPPGQAKKWARGRPLPRDVVYHDLPGHLSVRLNAPAGAKYVRVASDILLIAVGTGMVLDAIEDLHRM